MTTTRAASVLLLASLFGMLFAAGGVRPSYACECKPMTQEERFDSSDAVFAAQVMDIQELEDGYNVTFNVSQYWKGLSENDRYVAAELSSLDGNTCGYPFHEGERYLTYATRSGEDLRTGGCYGVSELAAADDTLAVLGAGIAPSDGRILFPGPDAVPLSTAAPPKPDLVLLSIVVAIASLSAGIAFAIIRKPKR